MRYEDTDRFNIIHRKEADLSYVTLAPVFRYTSIFKKNRYKQHQVVRLALVFGPQIGILTNGSLEYSLELTPIIVNDETLNYPYETIYYENEFYTDMGGKDKDFFNNIDFGFTLQAGIDIYPKPWFYISPTI